MGAGSIRIKLDCTNRFESCGIKTKREPSTPSKKVQGSRGMTLQDPCVLHLS